MPVKGTYFVYTGNAYPHKNLKRLIEAMVSLNKKSDQMIKLMISSSRGIFTQRLEKMIKDYSAESCVKLLGFVSDAKLPDLYKNSMGFVYPSLSEGFGLQGLETMTLKTLLLASDIPVFKEIYQDNAIYFDPKKPESITLALETALKMSPLEREKRIKKAEDFAKRYSWDKMAEETLKIYAESCDSLRQGK
jgi:glycosyltransferase involved in cell wall biosynthesis